MNPLRLGHLQPYFTLNLHPWVLSGFGLALSGLGRALLGLRWAILDMGWALSGLMVSVRPGKGSQVWDGPLRPGKGPLSPEKVPRRPGMGPLSPGMAPSGLVWALSALGWALSGLGVSFLWSISLPPSLPPSVSLSLGDTYTRATSP